MPLVLAALENFSDTVSKTDGLGVKRIPSPTLETDKTESLDKCNDSRILAGIVIWPLSLIFVTISSSQVKSIVKEYSYYFLLSE